jgi:nickel-type superoxide dismutase maturation protease
LSQYPPRVRRWWPFAVAAALAFSYLRYRPYRVAVEGSSMAPTLWPGDYLVATRPRRIRRGDVVVVAHPTRPLEVVKRVVALPGEAAEGRTLGPDEYLVLGDNPLQSTDGRSFGPVPRGSIGGVVRWRYWPSPGPLRTPRG